MSGVVEVHINSATKQFEPPRFRNTKGSKALFQCVPFIAGPVTGFRLPPSGEHPAQLVIPAPSSGNL